MKTEIEQVTEDNLKRWLIDSYAAVDAEKGSTVITIGGVKEEGRSFKLYCTSIPAAVELFKKDVAEFIGVGSGVGVRVWPTVRKTQFTHAEVWNECKGGEYSSSYARLIVTDMFQIVTFLNVDTVVGK